MAEAAGATLVNMDLLVPYFAGVENPPGSNRTMMISLLSGILSAFKGDVWVARDGKRFMNEDTPSPDERERALRKLPNAAIFTVFDDAILKANKPPLYNWDLLVQEGRVVKQARSIGALALELGLPPQELLGTIDALQRARRQRPGRRLRPEGSRSRSRCRRSTASWRPG